MIRTFLRKMYTMPIFNINENFVHNLNSSACAHNSNVANILITIDRNTQYVKIEHDTLSKYDNDFMLPKIKNLLKRYYPNYYHC